MRTSVPFLLDDLSVDGIGKFLIADLSHAPTLEAIAKNSHRCNAYGDKDKQGCELRDLSWVSEWSPEEGLKTLYAGDNFCSAMTGVRDVTRHVGMSVGLYPRGIFTWQD